MSKIWHNQDIKELNLVKWISIKYKRMKFKKILTLLNVQNHNF